MTINWDNLPPSAVPETVRVRVLGSFRDCTAQKLGQAVADWILYIGRFIDWDTLDEVVVAVDYDAALAQVDRGLEGLRPLSPSNTDEMQGVAMSPTVVREGRLRTQLVFSAAPLLALAIEG